MEYVISIDQSTSATKAVLFDALGHLVAKASQPHRQYYPQSGWVEHDAEEIYQNTLKVIKEVVKACPDTQASFSLSLTNQRETVVVWNRLTHRPIAHAIVWQDVRGAAICNDLRAAGHEALFQARTGLRLDPYFSGSAIRWLLDNTSGARAAAASGKLAVGTTDCYLIYRLTNGQIHATDFTNASRTLLFNIHTLQWDADLLSLLTVPASMLPEVYPSDTCFGYTTAEGVFAAPVAIAGVLGDSHGALVGQQCFAAGEGKATYGTGSSVMVNIGQHPQPAPDGLVTSVGFAALGKVYYAFEGNIHCQGATLQWLKNQLHLIGDIGEIEAMANAVADNGGVYLVPAFVGLGAPWWDNQCRASLTGMSLATTRQHVCRAALESIAYQVNDLVRLMTEQAHVALQCLAVDGGPTRNATLMQFQADMLQAPVRISAIEEASALGAMYMNRLALGRMSSLDDFANLQPEARLLTPRMPEAQRQTLLQGWLHAVHHTLSLS